MKKIIRKILKEDRRQMFLNKIVQVMKNDFPLFKNMESYGFTEQLSEEELNYVFSGIFGEPVVRDGNYVTSNTTYKMVVLGKNGNMMKEIIKYIMKILMVLGLKAYMMKMVMKYTYHTLKVGGRKKNMMKIIIKYIGKILMVFG
jgi:hypothetical protein